MLTPNLCNLNSSLIWTGLHTYLRMVLIQCHFHHSCSSWYEGMCTLVHLGMKVYVLLFILVWRCAYSCSSLYEGVCTLVHLGMKVCVLLFIFVWRCVYFVHLDMKVYVNLSEINFKWCKIKPSDLLRGWNPELELITGYFQMLEFLILKTESINLDLITYTKQLCQGS